MRWRTAKRQLERTFCVGLVGHVGQVGRPTGVSRKVCWCRESAFKLHADFPLQIARGALPQVIFYETTIFL